MAQERIHTGKTKTLSSTVSSSVIRQGNPTGVNHSSTLILADDFSTPGTWVISHAAGTIGDWVIGPNPPAGFFPIDPINSGSAINGFARFDSDSICSHDQIGNITSASSINLSAYAGIRFSFSQYYRRFHDSTYVIISTDNINWTRFPVNGNLAAGQLAQIMRLQIRISLLLISLLLQLDKLPFGMAFSSTAQIQTEPVRIH